MTFQYSPLNGETFFKDVYRLPEGHYYTYKDGKLDIQQYWDADFETKKRIPDKNGSKNRRNRSSFY